MLWRLTLLLNLPVCISCLLRGEKHPRLCPFGEELKVVVSPVIDDLGDRGKDPLLRHRYILFFPVYDHTEGGHIAIMVQHRVLLHSALGATEFRSIMRRGTQMDHGGIQADRFLLELEFACAADLSRDKLIESAEHLHQELSRPVSIGMRQGPTSGG